MLGNRMSNQDEDEVEDELEAMEREVNGTAAVPAMPDAPSQVVEGEMPEVPTESAEEKARRRRLERAEKRQLLAA
jgi:charged multivesicular body protein 6